MSSVEDVSEARRRAAERRAKRRAFEGTEPDPADGTGQGGGEGAMLIRLARVRPGARGVPAIPDETDPAVRPDGEPALPGRSPLPQRGDGAARSVDRSPSIDRLVASGRKRLSGTLLSFLLMVIVPSVAAWAYYAFIASPQYVSEFRFSVRGQDGAPSDSLSAATMVNPIAVIADNYLVADFAGSRDVVDKLENEVGLRRVYGADSIDWLSRFDRSASVEALVRYWGSMVDAHFDMTTGINSVTVRAFTPEDAHSIAVALQRMCEELVNGISERARQTQLRYAEDQVARAEEKLKQVRARETDFRTRVKSVDASKTAEAQIALASKIEGDLSVIRTEYDMVSKYLDNDSPRLKVLRDQIASTEAQLATVNGRVNPSDVAGAGAATDAATISEYENLQTDSAIALKIYEAALTSYEQARLRAVTDQLFLATFVQPTRPEDAAYPRSGLDTLLFFLSCFGVWVVVTLVYYSIRDHAH